MLSLLLRIADQRFDDPRAAECRAQQDGGWRSGHDLADLGSINPERVGPQRCQPGSGLRCGNDGDEFALIGDLERVDTEQFARASDHGAQREPVFGEEYGQSAGVGQFVADGADAAAGDRLAGEQARQCGGIGAAAAIAEGKQPPGGGESTRRVGGGGGEEFGVGCQRGPT